MSLGVHFPVEGVLEIRIERPESKGALNKEIVAKALEVLATHRKKVRAVIVSSVGDVFCAGADLKERRTMSMDDVRKWLMDISNLMDTLELYPAPVIASVQGPAFGGGCELALACDFRIMVKKAFFQLPEVGLGIIPGAGGTYRLPRIVGRSMALEMIMLQEKVGAERSFQMGLCTQVVEDEEELRTATLKLAERFLRMPPLALMAAKNAIIRSQGIVIEGRRQVELINYEVCLRSKDRLEALAAFAEKREPKFTGQ